MVDRLVTPETIQRLAEQGGFRIEADQVVRRARQVGGMVREAEKLRALPLGLTAPAVPWLRPREE